MVRWILLGLVVVLVVAAVVLYNRLVELRNRIESAWAHIDVQLRRRYDLIPNLIETVKGHAGHERDVLEQVTRARAAAASAGGVAEQARADDQLSSALTSLFAVSEAYPELGVDQGFLQLREDLSATEGRVAYAGQFYNDTVLRYNTRIQSFPSLVFARALQFRPREYFEANGAVRGPVPVDF
ncbi:MAG: LemA family protein [Actinobacteria bacterium]|nr:LemA family protein [Actinomycetota bacterium]MBW3641428.1 LemA family protein [Actinomycetota bacterium]